MTTSDGKLKVFISWSMPVSHSVAKVLRDWLPRVIQDVEPWVSSEDIEKGTYWTEKIVANLDSSRVGIIVVTPENYERSWLNFEAGALGRSIKASGGIVAPLLIDMDTASIQGPMTTLQLTNFNIDDIIKLLRAINDRTRTPVDDRYLMDQIELLWPRLEESIKKIVTTSNLPIAPKLKDREILEELLEGIRELRRQRISMAPGPSMALAEAMLEDDTVARAVVDDLVKVSGLSDLRLLVVRSSHGHLVAITAPYNEKGTEVSKSAKHMALLDSLKSYGFSPMITRAGAPDSLGFDPANPEVLNVIYRSWPDSSDEI